MAPPSSIRNTSERLDLGDPIYLNFSPLNSLLLVATCLALGGTR